MDALLILFLIALNGVFAMSEMAVSVSKKSRLKSLADEGDHSASRALELMEHPTHFLSTVQVGITSIGMLNGILADAAFNDDVSALLLQTFGSAGLTENAAGMIATAFVVTIITFASIVFGELVPKRIGLLFPETIARHIASPMQALATLARPFVWLLSTSTQACLKLLRLDKTLAQSMTEEEIHANLSEGVDAGVIEAHEQQMVRNVFHLDERALSSLMIPRSDVEWFDAALTISQCLEAAGESGHSYYPVCKDGLNNVLGVVAVADMLAAKDKTQAVNQMMVEAVFVPETLSGLELLERYRQESSRLVFVVDEYGVVQGILTPLDLLEAITGELQTEEAEDAWARQIDDTHWELDGLMPISELKSRLELKPMLDEEKGIYNTLAGALTYEVGDLLSVGQHIELQGWRFTVKSLQGRRADKIVATQL